MEFGVTFPSKITDYQYVSLAEKLGYDQCWFYDSQLLYSDVYATMALAADRTTKIRLGTGVAVAGTRLAPTIAHSIATINQLAPGRVEFGFGTGYTGWLSMGMKPPRLDRLREDFECIKEILLGKTGSFSYGDQERPVKHLHPDQGFINAEDPVTLTISAFGPKTVRYTARNADAHLVWGSSLSDLEEYRSILEEAAQEVGRDPSEVPTKGIFPTILLRADETPESTRVQKAVAPFLTNFLHGAIERDQDSNLTNIFGESFPPKLEETIELYRKHARNYPDETRHLRLHEGHLVYARKDEQEFLDPELAEQVAIIGSPDEIIEQIRNYEQAGVDHFAFQVTHEPADQIARFSTQVMDRY